MSQQSQTCVVSLFYSKISLNYKPFHIFWPQSNITSNSGSWGASIIPKKKIVMRKKTGGARQLVDNAEPYDSSKRLTIITTVSKWWYLKGNHKFLVSKISSVWEREMSDENAWGRAHQPLPLMPWKHRELPPEHQAMPSILLVVFHGQNSTNHFAKDFITDLFKRQRASQAMRDLGWSTLWTIHMFRKISPWPWTCQKPWRAFETFERQNR